MAKIHVKSQFSGDLEADHDSWKEWILEWEPSEIDLLVEKYDPHKGLENLVAAGSLASRGSVDTEGETCISAPPQRQVLNSPLSRVRSSQERAPSTHSPIPPSRVIPPSARFARKPQPNPDPITARRLAAREAFQNQVQ